MFLCHSTMLVNQIMNIILLCLYLFCENHFFCLYLFCEHYFVCTCSVLLLFCFHVVSGQ